MSTLEQLRNELDAVISLAYPSAKASNAVISDFVLPWLKRKLLEARLDEWQAAERDAFRKGQEEMRERCALASIERGAGWLTREGDEIARAIRSLPLKERPE